MTDKSTHTSTDRKVIHPTPHVLMSVISCFWKQGGFVKSYLEGLHVQARAYLGKLLQLNMPLSSIAATLDKA